MKMSSKNIFLIIGLILAILNTDTTMAQNPDKILIIDLYYNQGKLDIMAVQHDYGYYPDRLVQPSSGYRLSMIGDSEVYSFIFPDPRIIFTDVSDKYNNLKGGILILNETSFSLIVPDIKEAKQIIITDQNDEKVTSLDIKSEEVISKPPYNVIITILLFISLSILFIAYKKKKKDHKKR